MMNGTRFLTTLLIFGLHGEGMRTSLLVEMQATNNEREERGHAAQIQLNGPTEG